MPSRHRTPNWQEEGARCGLPGWRHGQRSCQLPCIVLTSPAGSLQTGNCCLHKAAQGLHSVCLQAQL